MRILLVFKFFVRKRVQRSAVKKEKLNDLRPKRACSSVDMLNMYLP
jgi:hypothetical protein